jgi:hypothetical protein
VVRWSDQAKAGTRTVSIDEMSGVQALERAAPSLPMKPGKTERREYEYKRRGTQVLIAAFGVSSPSKGRLRVRSAGVVAAYPGSRVVASSRSAATSTNVRFRELHQALGMARMGAERSSAPASVELRVESRPAHQRKWSQCPQFTRDDHRWSKW